MSTKKITKIAILSALSVVLVYLIRFPIFPSAPYLEYDPADIPLLIASFMYGPLYAIIATVIVCIIQGLTVSAKSGWLGIVMHIIATGTFVTVASSIYYTNKKKSRAIIGLICGSIAMSLIMIPANLYFTVNFNGVPYDVVKTLLPTTIIPFNLIKTTINSIITFFIYKKLETLINKI